MGGAVEKIWYGLGQEFARRGHEVTHVSQEHESLNKEELVEGVRHIRIPGFEIPRSLVRLKWRDLVYSRRALKVLPESDVLVTNTFWLPIIAPRAKCGRLYVHIARYPKGQMKFYGKAARLQAVSTVIGNAVRDEAPQLAPKVRVIPNFISEVDPGAENTRGKSILYVGRVHPEKGLNLLLEAFARVIDMGFTDWKLRVLGPWQTKFGGGGEAYFETLRLKSQAISDQVEWVGPVFDAEQLHAYYRQSSFFVYPSLAARGEACPLAPLEAMAAGCPPLVSSLDCFKDYLKPGTNGWSFDHNSRDSVGSLATALHQVVSESDSLAGFRKSAVQTAEEYTLPKVADLYLRDFQELVSA
jgi:glycosyltransferase involved in cell wall biosynthesis